MWSYVMVTYKFWSEEFQQEDEKKERKKKEREAGIAIRRSDRTSKLPQK